MESWLSPVCFLPAPGLKVQPELKRCGESWLGQILTNWSWRDLWVWFGWEKFGDFCPVFTAWTQDWMNSEMDMVGHSMDMVGPGDLKGLFQSK